ncbi:glutathione S-transferase family protein [Endozoicomonas sp. SM1973]|uniref:Glutathione S-transferase family protein n=1 Tax=Spartinivicinus marinus TaxID=2994442 RepID=A0A853HW57_9GAMM|nr:glutathione S-transferase family protein [Spartinivicinus marinus]MCX4026805.1 glutathione S-transferase family protein [Spartinivicinus marinus]NYZ64639.1 glutathione S-transferase family protein [Spartinivicinus marinus]
MVKLYGFGSGFGVVDPSPFVLKVDAYLRMSGIKFETVSSIENLKKAPKGKLPFIEDDGKVVGDSYFIIEYLGKKYQSTLDQWLSDEQKAIAHLVSKSLDENFYWCIVYSRWMCEDTWPILKKAFFSSMPFPLKQILPSILRSGVKKSLNKQGLGRHSNDEIQQIYSHSLASLSAMLGEKSYFLGDKPCSLDASAYAFLAECILVEIDNDFNKIARRFDNLVGYCKRVQDEFYKN